MHPVQKVSLEPWTCFAKKQQQYHFTTAGLLSPLTAPPKPPPIPSLDPVLIWSTAWLALLGLSLSPEEHADRQIRTDIIIPARCQETHNMATSGCYKPCQRVRVWGVQLAQRVSDPDTRAGEPAVHTHPQSKPQGPSQERASLGFVKGQELHKSHTHGCGGPPSHYDPAESGPTARDTDRETTEIIN